MEENTIDQKFRLVVIGGSAGSLEVLLNLLSELKQDLQLSLLIILHRQSSSDSVLADLLMTRTKLPVKEAEEKEMMKTGHIYIAPSDYHLLIENDLSLSLDYSEKVHYSRPSIDVSFESAARAMGPAVAGILLSGANQDGTLGLQEIKRNGGFAVVQNPKTAAVPFMPQHAQNLVKTDKVLNPEEMAAFINNLPA